MGNKGAKGKVPPKAKLNDKDIKHFAGQTGLPKEQIVDIFNQFSANNPDGVLNRQEFVRLYDQLRPEPLERIDEIAQYVFNAFDTDRNGTITFSEFLVAFVLTSRGDPKKKLEYAFTVYDADHNGYLDPNEVRNVLGGMLDLLGAEKKNYNINQLTDECLKTLDASRDGKVSKDEFINGLLSNFALRSLMNPFN